MCRYAPLRTCGRFAPFGAPLTAFFFSEEGQYIKVGGVEGRITELHPLYAELEYLDQESGGIEHIQVPMTMLLTTIVKRNFVKEAQMPKTSLDPNRMKLV